MGYLIYGKVIKAGYVNKIYYDKPQKTFRALTRNGVRVNKLSDAFVYSTKQEAQQKLDEVLSKIKHKDMVMFEIRKA